MKVTHIIEYAAFQSVSFLVGLLPLRGAQIVGRKLGRFVYGTLGYRKDVTLGNLRRAFPEKTEVEITRVACGAYENIGISLFELLWVPHFTSEQLAKMVRLDHPEVLLEAYARKKGVLILTAHFGNWEILGQSLLAQFGVRVNGIAKTQSNPLVNRSIDKRRELFGNRVIPMETSLREVLKALRDGEMVGIVADQAAPKENIPVEFFGTMVPTHQGPSAICLKTGSPLVAIFTVRASDGTYDAFVEEVPTSDLVGSNEENVTELTRRHVKVTEKYIRMYPDHWLWQHKRWKHVPLENSVQGNTVQ